MKEEGGKIEELTLELDAARIFFAEEEEEEEEEEARVVVSLKDITERKQAEEELQESEERYKSLVRGVVDAVILVDTKGKILLANDMALVTLGKPARQIINRNLNEVLPAGEAKVLLASVKRVVRTKKPTVYVDWLNKRFLESVIAPALNNEGKVISVTVVGRDLSERKEMEEKLDAAQKRLRTIMDNIEVGILIIDAENHKIIDANPRAVQMFGDSRENITGKVCHKYICPAERGKCPISDLGQIIDKSERVLINVKGEQIPILKNVKPLSIKGNKYLIESFIDISELKRREEELNKFKVMVETAHDAIFYKDLESRYIIVNKKTSGAFGLSREEVIGKNDLEIMPDKKEAKANITDDQLVFKTGEPTEILKHMTSADGREYWFQAIKVPQFDNQGKVVGLVGIARDITAQKNAEKALRKSEEKYRTIFQNTNDVIAYVDKYGVILEVNKKVEALFGYKPDELIGKRFTKLGILLAKDLPRFAKLFWTTMRGNQYIPLMETAIKNKKGEEVPIEASTRLIEKEGEITGILTIIRDISERKRAEAELSKSEEKYRNLAERANDGITIIQDGIVKYLNPRLAEMWGGSVEEIIGTPFTKYVHPNELPLLADRCQRRIAGEAVPQVYESLLLRNDGGEVHAELNSSLINYEEKPAVLVFVRDITRRRKAENALQDSEERYRNLFIMAPAGIFLLDKKGRILSVNDSAVDTYGYSRKELLKSNVRLIIPREISRNYSQLVENVKKETQLHLESYGRKKDGTVFPVSLSVRLIPLGGNELLQVLVRDVTERKMAEAASQFEKLAGSLIKVQEEERKRIARELHDEIGQDLSVIKLTVGMIKKDYPGLNSSLQEELQGVSQLVDATMANVRRISARMRPEALDELGLIPCLRQEVKSTAERAGIEIECETKAFKGRINPQTEVVIYRVAQEALTNIIKHSHATKGGVRLSRSRKKEAINLKIWDNGKGFMVSGLGKSRGLGFLGMRERLMAVGGTMKILSRPGQGTRLEITIPV